LPPDAAGRRRAPALETTAVPVITLVITLAAPCRPAGGVRLHSSRAALIRRVAGPRCASLVRLVVKE
jgi:hypothetical protein